MNKVIVILSILSVILFISLIISIIVNIVQAVKKPSSEVQSCLSAYESMKGYEKRGWKCSGIGFSCKDPSDKETKNNISF